MPYIGNPIYQSAFVTDQFSGNGSTTAFTMSVAPAGTSNVLVVVSGVVQDPSTYGVVGNTLNFTTAPPSGTGNISCRYLGVPVTGVTTTAYRTKTEFTATAGQTTFTPPSYTVGYIDVFRNGVLLGSADYSATNGTTVVLATGATAGDLITTESFYVSSVLNAIPNTTGSISSSNLPASLTIVTPTINQINNSVTGSSLGAGNASIMKNRIINGAMAINQRGFSGTPTNGQYTLDRWYTGVAQASKLTISQNAGSVTPPVGFVNYLGITSSSAYSVTSTDYFYIEQIIEGLNVGDLAWGTANAKTITVSAQVYSSLTGTFGGVIQNGAGNRSYPFTYTISSANTWTSISVTIAGDTTGTWPTDNSGSLVLLFSVGAGATRSGSAGAWAGAAYYAPTGAVSVVGTSGATFYITGVQLEVGSSATGFEYRQFTTELQLCQRYFCKTFDLSTAPAQNTNTSSGAIWGCVRAFGGASGNNWEPQQNWYFPVTMRAAPSVTVYAVYTGITSGQWGNSSTVSASNTRVLSTGMTSAIFDNTGNTVAFGSNSPNIHATASIEL